MLHKITGSKEGDLSADAHPKDSLTWSWDLSLPFHKVILGTMLKFSKPSNPQM